MDALVKAIIGGDVEEVRRILQSSANAKELVNTLDIDQYNSLFHVTKVQNEQAGLAILNLLIEKGANPLHKDENKQTVIFYLAKDGKAKIIERLLQSYNYNLNEVDTYNQNPLYWAARFGRLKVAELLLKYGVNINHLDDYAQTCLFFAATEGHLQMCKFLINRGCQYDWVDKIKKTPLHFARDNKRTSVVEYLLSLKEQHKRNKQKESKSQGPETKPKKKKETVRAEYVLAYASEEGGVREVTMGELEELAGESETHAKLLAYMKNPDLLENVDTKHEKRFLKVANKILNAYLKRVDLSIFCNAVDTNIYADYLQHVSRPMDFGTIKTKLQFGCYEHEEEFKIDVVQVYQNCILYNGAESQLGRMANQLKFQFHQTFRKESLIL